MTEHPERVVAVASVAEALSHLTTQRGRARIVAGLAGLSGGLNLPEGAYLVDVSEVAALRRIELADDWLLMGGAVSLAALAKHPEVELAAPLVTAASWHHAEGGRGAETLAARVVSSRGGDPINAALVALGAQAEITNLTGAQWLPVASLYVRQGLSRVDSSSEILTRFRLPVGQGAHGGGIGVIAGGDGTDAYALALAVVLDASGERFAQAQLSHGADWVIPTALPEVAERLVGVALDDKERLRAFVAQLIELEMTMLGSETPEWINEGAFREACHTALKGAARTARRRLAPREPS